MNNKNIQYNTKWRQGNKSGVYSTKSLTGFHKAIHESPKTDYACTIVIDPSVPWPLGVYAEIIAVTNKKEPNKNKPFTTYASPSTTEKIIP